MDPAKDTSSRSGLPQEDASRAPAGPDDAPPHHEVIRSIRRTLQDLADGGAGADRIARALARVGSALQVDAVVHGLYRLRDDDHIEARIATSWVAERNGQPALPLPRSGDWIDLREAGLQTPLEPLHRGEIVSWQPRPEEGAASARLHTAGIGSILAGPVRVDGRLVAGISLLQARPAAWSAEQVESVRLLCSVLAILLEANQVQQALRRSEERYRQVAEAATEYIWETDAEGRIVYLSDRVVDVLGYPIEAILGHTPFDFMVPEGRTVVEARFRRLASRALPFRGLEHLVSTASGARIWLSASGSPILAEDGTLVGYRGTATDITAQKRVGEILRESRERLAATQASMDDLLFTLDAEGRFEEYVQPRHRGLLVPPEQFVGRSIHDVLPPQLAGPLSTILQATAESGDTRQMDYEVDLEGEHTWWSARVSPRHDRTGRLAGFTIVSRDVTQMRLAQMALQARDRILETVQQAAEIVLKAADWRAAVNEAFACLAGTTRADQVTIWRVFRAEEAGQVEARRLHYWARRSEDEARPASIHLPGGLVRQIADRITRERQIRIPGSDLPADFVDQVRGWGIRSLLIVPVRSGSDSWDALTLTHLESPYDWSNPEIDALRTAGSLLGALIQREAIADELRESEEKYRSLVESAAQPILIIDGAGVVRFTNLAAAAETGLTPAALTGRTLWEIHPPAVADRHAAGIRDVLQSGRAAVRQVETTILSRSRWYEARLTPLRNLREIGDAVLLILTDITERREGEKRILEYQDRLRTLTAELTLAEERERRKIASGLHDQIGQTLAMAKIRLASARAEGFGPVVQEVIELLDRTIQDTRSLTFDLSPPVLHELGLGPAIEWLLERIEARHGLQTTLAGGDTPVNLRGDFLGFLFRSVQELVVNAVKHARATKVDVRLRRESDRLYIDVADDGIGFEPAERKGGGFGLFSIRERLQHLGGGLGIESRPGQGTRCRIWVSVPEGRDDGEKESGT